MNQLYIQIDQTIEITSRKYRIWKAHTGWGWDDDAAALIRDEFNLGFHWKKDGFWIECNELEHDLKLISLGNLELQLILGGGKEQGESEGLKYRATRDVPAIAKFQGWRVRYEVSECSRLNQTWMGERMGQLINLS